MFSWPQFNVFLSLLWVSFAHGYTPLVDKRVPWNQIPYKVDTDVGLIRGEQLGYNQCNSTTEGPQSLCQTAYINSLDEIDFCIWAPSIPGKSVGEIEGEMIAWCARGGHGTRIMPEGTLKGVQFTKSPDYVQVVGFMDQTKINMVKGDAGGEMDPHGADQRGNPMGGLLYSNAFTGTYQQVIEWHNFNGNDHFCLKACDPSRPNGPQMCEHIYDTQGCVFNAPSNARQGIFESCASDSQNPPGQGPAVAPRSSSCSVYQSTDIYGGGTQVPIPGAQTMSFSSTPAAVNTRTSENLSATSTSITSSGSMSAGGVQANMPAATGSTNGAGGLSVPFLPSFFWIFGGALFLFCSL